MAKRLFLIVLDSFGMGALPDAERFGDAGCNTLASVAGSGAFHAPNLCSLGLFNIEGAAGGAPVDAPGASFARLASQSPAKDTTVGHWEIAGVIAQQPLPTYPDGFPPEIIDRLYELTYQRFLCNKPYSGTEVLKDFGREHIRTGLPILYTSADSVMQFAAHEDIVKLQDLYDLCETARRLMQFEHGVGRVIARPFTGDPPDFVRTSGRRDYSLPPPQPTMLDILSGKWMDVIGVGKIYDIFAGHGVTRVVKSADNDEGMQHALELIDKDFSGLCFVNLVDFDMKYGHRNDVDGYAGAISAFDKQLGVLMQRLHPEDAVVLTADHGCDPGAPGTDHTREYVPMLMFGPGVRQGVDLGTRETFADIAATTLEFFGFPPETAGTSFLSEVLL